MAERREEGCHEGGHAGRRGARRGPQHQLARHAVGGQLGECGPRAAAAGRVAARGGGAQAEVAHARGARGVAQREQLGGAEARVHAVRLREKGGGGGGKRRPLSSECAHLVWRTPIPLPLPAETYGYRARRAVEAGPRRGEVVLRIARIVVRHARRVAVARQRGRAVLRRAAGIKRREAAEDRRRVAERRERGRAKDGRGPGEQRLGEGQAHGRARVGGGDVDAGQRAGVRLRRVAQGRVAHGEEAQVLRPQRDQRRRAAAAVHALLHARGHAAGVRRVVARGLVAPAQAQRGAGGCDDPGRVPADAKVARNAIRAGGGDRGPSPLKPPLGLC